MCKWKPIVKYLLYLVYGGVSGFLTPTFLLFAFNFSDGIQHNPEDEMFIPFGIAALVVLLMIDVWIVLRTVLSQSIDKCHKAVVLCLFWLVKIGFVLLNQLDVQLFTECFLWKLEHQWLR